MRERATPSSLLREVMDAATSGTLLFSMTVTCRMRSPSHRAITVRS